MKKTVCLIVFIISALLSCSAIAPPPLVSPSLILMEKHTGNILFEKDSHTQLPPASVTKIMTLLLVMERIDSGELSLNDMVHVSENAANMGGSQVFLAQGEEMSVNDMLKATFISSGNDSAVALAEHICGSESAFVELMNKRAKELGMNDTVFKNCTGLDTEGHITSAHDIALMSRELIHHETIRNYTTTWIDTLRNGTFQLANTNKLVRTYKGITGLKTGSTSVAKYCLSATAERDGMELIAVILAAPSSKERFSDASKLLDFGFANYSLYNPTADSEPTKIPVILGEQDYLSVDFGRVPSVVIEKNKLSSISNVQELPEEISAPVEKGQKIGVYKIICENELLDEIPIIAAESIKKLSVGDILFKLLSVMLMH